MVEILGVAKGVGRALRVLRDPDRLASQRRVFCRERSRLAFASSGGMMSGKQADQSCGRDRDHRVAHVCSSL